MHWLKRQDSSESAKRDNGPRNRPSEAAGSLTVWYPPDRLPCHQSVTLFPSAVNGRAGPAVDPVTGVAPIVYFIYLSFIFMFLICSFFVLLHQSFNIFWMFYVNVNEKQLYKSSLWRLPLSFLCTFSIHRYTLLKSKFILVFMCIINQSISKQCSLVSLKNTTNPAPWIWILT